ncbi:MAG: RagB/SusD family nutrient uptake outer membrane protein [Ginsengibacter sp.]
MKKLLYILTTAIITLPIISCKKDLNISPVDQFSDASVWKDPSLIQTFVNNIYGGIPHGFSNIMMSALDDEAMYNADFGTSNVTKSLITPSDLSIFDANYWTGMRQRLMNWAIVYKYVRACNIFFSKIDGATFDNPSQKDRLKGEVHFLRAYLYFDLVEMYGGVPIITKAYGLSDTFNVARNSYADCITFISNECDSAASLLPLTATDLGRATKGAALALKARTLLYAASDFANSDGSWAGSYPDKELIGYTGGDRTARWQAAKDAAKAVMDLGIYSLYGDPNPATAEEASTNYANIFLLPQTSEDIFARYFSTKVDENWDGYNPGLYNQPNGYHCWGSNTPTSQMVDSYEMNDGSSFDWNNPTEAADPYANRDPRFYASILYEGAQWRQRPADIAPSDPAGIIQVGTWQKWDGSQMVTVPGLDTRQSPFENWNGTYTGYYMRKFMDPKVDAQNFKQTAPWRFIRYTEILLDYAEACLGLGEEDEAKTYINMVRARSKMPPITETGAALVERYRNERKIELAFEDQRYFDIRRWMIPEEGYTDVMAVQPVYKLNPDHTTAATPTYTRVDVQGREWNPRFYFLPIALDEMNRNDKLVQNPLY